MNKTLITIGSVVLALILAVVLVWPKYQVLNTLKTEIGRKDAEFQSKREYFSQLREISRKLENYEENLSKISSALPQDSSLPSLFNFLQMTSSQTGLVLGEIKLSGITTSKESQELKEIRVNLRVAGKYPAFKNFLLALETSARLIEVEKISFSYPKESKESFSFGIEIKTQGY